MELAFLNRNYLPPLAFHINLVGIGREWVSQYQKLHSSLIQGGCQSLMSQQRVCRLFSSYILNTIKNAEARIRNLDIDLLDRF